MQYYIVKYIGPFGFIKPWTAVADGETFSQQFLTPSIVEGIEKKLFPELLNHIGIHKIRRHRLSYSGISQQQERTQARGWNVIKKEATRPQSVITRGVMLHPQLLLAFDTEEEAQIAKRQHICLCRNEDILLPDDTIIQASKEEFDTQEEFSGFELLFGEGEGSFLVGYNRFQQASPMYGRLHIVSMKN